MIPIFQLELQQSIPFEYLERASSTGFRIGGWSPKGVDPVFRTSRQKYFGTVEVEDGHSISIFYSFEIFGEDIEYDVISFNNQLLYPSKLIHSVVHRNSPADNENGIASEVTCHAIEFRKTIEDWPDGDDRPYPFSKAGGHPYIDNIPRVGHVFEQANAEGFRQIIQFDTPLCTQYPYVDGFPWDPGCLHVFVRGPSLERMDFAFVVQQ